MKDPVTGYNLPRGWNLNGPRSVSGRFGRANTAALWGWRMTVNPSKATAAIQESRYAGQPVVEFYRAWIASHRPGISHDRALKIEKIMRGSFNWAPGSPQWNRYFFDLIPELTGAVMGGSRDPRLKIVPNSGVWRRIRPYLGHKGYIAKPEPVELLSHRAMKDRRCWPYSGSEKPLPVHLSRDKKRRRFASAAAAFAAFDGYGHQDTMDRLHAIAEHFDLGIVHNPAQLAWKIWRSLLKAPLPIQPVHMMYDAVRCSESGYIIKESPRRSPHEFIYDMNCAYGHYLRRWPDLSKGWWRYFGPRVNPIVQEWGIASVSGRPDSLSPFGVYRLRDGSWRSGFAMFYDGNQLADRDSVTEGWYWYGEAFAGGPFEEFVHLCAEETWPLPGLMRHLPRALTGKFYGKIYEPRTHTFKCFGSWQPVLYKNITGGLHGYMRQLAHQHRANYVYVDSLHIDHALPGELLGRGVGQFKDGRKLQGGWLDYIGPVNQFRGEDIEKHQGHESIAALLRPRRESVGSWEEVGLVDSAGGTQCSSPTKANGWPHFSRAARQPSPSPRQRARNSIPSPRSRRPHTKAASVSHG